MGVARQHLHRDPELAQSRYEPAGVRPRRVGEKREADEAQRAVAIGARNCQHAETFPGLRLSPLLERGKYGGGA